MIDKELEEQLERMRRLNEQLSAMQRGVSENNQLIARDRTMHHGPLGNVRDFRTHQSPDYEDYSPEVRAATAGAGVAEDAPRRRRR